MTFRAVVGLIFTSNLILNVSNLHKKSNPLKHHPQTRRQCPPVFDHSGRFWFNVSLLPPAASRVVHANPSL